MPNQDGWFETNRNFVICLDDDLTRLLTTAMVVHNILYVHSVQLIQNVGFQFQNQAHIPLRWCQGERN